MTGELRERLRVAVDAAARAAFDFEDEPRCAACGVELTDPWTELPRYTLGCRTCSDRRYTRAKRLRS